MSCLHQRSDSIAEKGRMIASENFFSVCTEAASKAKGMTSGLGMLHLPGAETHHHAAASAVTAADLFLRGFNFL